MTMFRKDDRVKIVGKAGFNNMLAIVILIYPKNLIKGDYPDYGVKLDDGEKMVVMEHQLQLVQPLNLSLEEVIDLKDALEVFQTVMNKSPDLYASTDLHRVQLLKNKVLDFRNDLEKETL